MNKDWLGDIGIRGAFYAAREQVIKLCKYYDERSTPLDVHLIKCELEELFNITEDEYISSEQSIIKEVEK